MANILVPFFYKEMQETDMTKNECDHYDSAMYKSSYDWTQANEGYELFMRYKHHLSTFNAYGLRMTSKGSELYEVITIPVDSVGKAPEAVDNPETRRNERET